MENKIKTIPERYLTSDGFMFDDLNKAQEHEEWIPEEKFTGFNNGEFYAPVNLGAFGGVPHNVPHQVLENFLLTNRNLIEEFFKWDEDNPGIHRKYFVKYQERIAKIKEEEKNVEK